MKRLTLLAVLAALLGVGAVALAAPPCTGNPCVCKMQPQGLSETELKP